MKKRTVNVLLAILACLLLVLSPFTSSFADERSGFHNLTEIVGQGFGSTWNRYAWSMAVHDDHVYVGTWSNQIDWPALIQAIASGELADLIGEGVNPLEGIGFVASDGGEIWRHDGGQSWTRVAKATPDTTGFRIMITYKEQLYAGTANSDEGAELWVKKEDPSVAEAETWEAVLSWPQKPDNNSIRALATFTSPSDGEEWLLVGTENNRTGAELWAFDGSEWMHVTTLEEVHSIAEIAVYEDRYGEEKVYAGTWTFVMSFLEGSPADTFQLYSSADPLVEDFVNVKPVFPGREYLSNLGVMKLVEYADRLYLGTVNYIDGFTLLSSDDPSEPDSWTVLTTNGFENSDSAYFWSAVVVDGMLVAGTFNSGISGGLLPLLPLDGRAQILYTTDGVNFQTMVDDGFGVPFTYGIRCMAVSGQQLVVGTATNFMIPDFQTSLYEDVQFEELLAVLYEGDYSAYEQIAPYLAEGLEILYASYDDDPFIGTQVWARPISALGKETHKYGDR